ncbi:MAG: glycosyltransferase family 2 protein [Lachnospiraceae bacterium]|jgi:glycosyltransferases involved in cell wall biogenesis|nr:MAG: glycosyltransferase family 2 protein [Lachnospiraceae bacterium]
MEETLYIVMPTYNEEANIRNVVAEWYPILENAGENSRLVVSDGGSKDKTLDILNELKKEFPKLVVIPKPGTDHGTKVILLYKYAIEKGADWIFQTDSDGQTLPSEFEEFWKLRKKYDIIMGNRKKRGDGAGRKLVENVLRVYLKLFFGVMVPDANAPFRLMKADIVNKYIDLMPSNFNLPNAILAACFSRYKEKVTYRVVTFQPRQGGKNYMNVKRIFNIGRESIGNFAKIKKNLKAFEGR